VRSIPKLPSIDRTDFKPVKQEVRPPIKQTRYPSRPEGPQLYQVLRKPEKSDFPGDPPAEFLDPTLHGSRSEWWIYAALWKYFDDQPEDGYRRGPYIGSPEGKWAYQVWALGGRSTTGGAVPDFDIPAGRDGQSTILRIQSDRFHLTAGPAIVGSDDLQRMRLSEDHRVIDLYENDFLHLRGSDLVAWLADTLTGRQSVNPLTAGSFYRRRS
jgi:hypothetical protein